MNALLTDADAAAFLGITTDEGGAVLTAINDAVVAQLEMVTRQTFAAGAQAVDEPGNGRNLPSLFLKYPITLLTMVKVGLNPTSPDEVLDGANVLSVVVDPHYKRRIVRTDTQVFPYGIRNVFTTYNHGGNLTLPAKEAAREACAFVWRRRGSEDSSAESEAGWSHTLAKLDEVPAWKLYTDRFRRPVAR